MMHLWEMDEENSHVAYSGVYLEDTRNQLGWLLEYADVGGYDVQEIFDRFVNSKYIEYVKMCHPHYLGGCSSYEFASYVLEDEFGLELRNTEEAAPVTSWYWIGSYMALCQWWYNIDWKDMAKYLRMDLMQGMFTAGHTVGDESIMRVFRKNLELEGYHKDDWVEFVLPSWEELKARGKQESEVQES